MRLENGLLVAGANSILKYPTKIGTIIRMPGNGIYLSPNREYVMDYYSGLADDEVLLTFSFNIKDITTGNINDKEPELSVKQAIIKNIENI